jgi:hypothetical protein
LLAGFRLERILKRLNALGNKEVSIGFFKEDQYEDGLSVAQVAKWNDIGRGTEGINGRIPPRPFMSAGLRDLLKSRPYLRMYAQYLSKVLSGKMPVLSMYEQIGKFASEDLKEIIDRWAYPRNSPITIAIKGFNDPLIHTGKMRDSAKYKVKNSRKKRNISMRQKSTIRVR